MSTFGLSGCGTLSYLWQAGKGQLSLLNHARPVDDVLKDPRTSPRIKRLLTEIAAVKAFGESQGLKPTQNYREFVQLDRPAVVWVVSASEALHFRAKEWGFPVVGRFNYLGWFDRGDALHYADGLRKEGWDVDVRGATAYSTLGWFRDPVLSTMIPEGDEAMGELVNTIIHESVHATLYIKDESYFNESIASFIADQLTPIYLAQSPTVTAAERSAYELMMKVGAQRGEKMKDAYLELEALYASQASDSEKRDRKAAIYKRVKDELQFKRDINNATLIQYRTYGAGQKDFETLYAQFMEKARADSKTGASPAVRPNVVRPFLQALMSLKRGDFSEPQMEDFGALLARFRP